MRQFDNSPLAPYKTFFRPALKWFLENQRKVEDAWFQQDISIACLPSDIQNQQTSALREKSDDDLEKLDRALYIIYSDKLPGELPLMVICAVAYLGYQIDRELDRRNQVREMASLN